MYTFVSLFLLVCLFKSHLDSTLVTKCTFRITRSPGFSLFSIKCVLNELYACRYLHFILSVGDDRHHPYPFVFIRPFFVGVMGDDGSLYSDQVNIRGAFTVFNGI